MGPFLNKGMPSFRSSRPRFTWRSSGSWGGGGVMSSSLSVLSLSGAAKSRVSGDPCDVRCVVEAAPVLAEPVVSRGVLHESSVRVGEAHPPLPGELHDARAELRVRDH